MVHRLTVVNTEKFDLETVYNSVNEDDIVINPVTPETEIELINAASGSDALVLTRRPVTECLLQELPDLKVIGKVAVGIDDVDLTAVEEADTTVVHAPTYCVEEVSTHAFALLLSSVRRLRTYDEAVRNGEWNRDPTKSIHQLAGQTLGLVGFGTIARRVAEKASGFDLELLAYDPYVDVEKISKQDVRDVSFNDIVSESDLVSVHAPLTQETERMFDEDTFNLMKGGSVFVNTARGSIVDDEALATALDSGQVSAAGVDVFPEEPPTNSPLLHQENVILSPHIGWYSEESREECIQSVLSDIVRVLRGSEPDDDVFAEKEWI